MKVTHHKLATRTLNFTVNGKRTECKPKTQKNPCYPESYFGLLEKCKVCQQIF